MEDKIRGTRGTALYNEPVSPQGRVFLRREMDLSIDCFVTFQNPVDVVAVKAALASSVIRNCPRLRSVVVMESDGRHRWTELPEIDIDSHVVIVHGEEDEVAEQETASYINEYLAALPSLSPLTREIPPWEVHILPQRRRSLVLRFHHALGDCVSLLALFLASCDPADGILPIPQKAIARPSFISRVWAILKAARFSPAYWKEHYRLSMRRYEDTTLISRTDQLERLTRKLASVTLSLDDMKEVKNKLNAKINDVFVGVVSYAIAKYLALKSSEETSEQDAITGLVAVNLRGEGSKDLLRSIRGGKEVKWGNKLGFFVVPIQLKNKSDDPLNYVREAKTILDHKKNTFEAHFTHNINAQVIALFGLKTMASFSYNVRHNTDLFLSNIVGPSEPIIFGENLVTRIGVTLSSLPAALDVHMISYNGKAFLQFLVAEEIVPHPEQLCTCVQEALREMKAKL